MSKQQARSRSASFTFLATGANIGIVSLQAVILTPLYLKNIGLTTYGAWLGTGDLLLWLQAMDFGISNFAIQKMSAAHGRDDRQDIMFWFSSTLILLVLLGTIAMLVAWLASGFIFRPFDLSGADEGNLISAFRIAAVGLGLTLVNFAFAGLARAMQDVFWINGFTLLGSIIGFTVSFLLLRSGAGIYAIAYGMLVRAAVVFAGGIVFYAIIQKHFTAISRRPQLSHLKESLAIMPYSTLGSLGYAASNQSENAVISYFISPDTAAVYNTMKKLADMGRSLLETLTYATFAPFSSEYAERGELAGASYQRILRIHAIGALALCVLLILFNQPVLEWWVGGEIYLGHTVNALLALQIYSATRAYLLNSLDRAMQPPKFAYIFLIAEAILKLVVMFLLVRFAGVAAVPFTASLVALLALVYFRRRHRHLLGVKDEWSLIVFAGLASFTAFNLLPPVGIGMGLCTIVFVIIRWLRRPL